jgi:hypothetical protein
MRAGDQGIRRWAGASALGLALLYTTAQAMPVLQGETLAREGANACAPAGGDDRTQADGGAGACGPESSDPRPVYFADDETVQERFFMDAPDAAPGGDSVVDFVDLSVTSSMVFGAPAPGTFDARGGGRGIPVLLPGTWLLLSAGALGWWLAHRARGGDRG